MRRRPLDRRLVTAMLVVGLALGAGSDPAGAVPSPHKQGDPVDVLFGSADLRHLVVDYRQHDVVVTLRTEEPLNLATARAWRRPGATSRIIVPIDTMGTIAAEFRILVRPVAGVGATAVLQQMPGAIDRCSPFFTQPSSRNYIRFRFEHQCIDSAGHLRLYAKYIFDRGGDGTTNAVDRAPDTGRTPFVDPAT